MRRNNSTRRQSSTRASVLAFEPMEGRRLLAVAGELDAVFNNGAILVEAAKPVDFGGFDTLGLVSNGGSLFSVLSDPTGLGNTGDLLIKGNHLTTGAETMPLSRIAAPSAPIYWTEAVDGGNGTIVVSGISADFSDIYVAKINTDGTAVTSFGNDGFVTVSNSSYGAEVQVAVDGNGSIYLAGQYSTGITKLDGTGAVEYVGADLLPEYSATTGDLKIAGSTGYLTGTDSSTSQGFVSTFDILSGTLVGNGIGYFGEMLVDAGEMQINNAGAIYVYYTNVGEVAMGSGVAKLASDLSMDATFGTAGLAVLSQTLDAYTGYPTARTSLDLQSDGAVVVAGTYNDPDTYEYKVAVQRLAADGSMDSTFGTAGVVVLAPAVNDAAGVITSDALIVGDGIFVGGVDFDPSDEAYLAKISLTTSTTVPEEPEEPEEPQEPQLPAGVVLSANGLTYTASEASDSIEVNLDAAGKVTLIVNSTPLSAPLTTNGRVIINAGGGNDTITVTGVTTSAAIEIHGGAGNDTIIGGEGADLIHGDAGADLIFGAGGDDTIYGGAGNDIVFGGFGNDFIYGEGGNDLLFGDGGNDFINGGAGTDIILDIIGRNTLQGGGGFDIVLG